MGTAAGLSLLAWSVFITPTFALDLTVTTNHAQALAFARREVHAYFNVHKMKEIKLGDAAKTDREINLLHEILATLASHTDCPASDWQLFYYQGGDKGPNASSIGNATIVVSRELLEGFDLDKEQMAFVLAHEMSHYLNGVVDLISAATDAQIEKEMRDDAQQPTDYSAARVARTRRSEKGADVAGALLARHADFPGDAGIRWLDSSPEHARYDETSETRFGIIAKLDGHMDRVRRDYVRSADHGTYPDRRAWIQRAVSYGLPRDERKHADLVGLDDDLNVILPIVNCWKSPGHRDESGFPIDRDSPIFVHGWAGGKVQDVLRRDGETGCIMLRDGATTAYWVHGGIWAFFANNGGPDKYGYPTSEEYDVPVGRAQKFEHRTLIWNRSTGITTEGGVGIIADDRGTHFPGKTPDATTPASVPVDLIFCIDATGSMADDIDEVKKNAAELIRTTRTKCPDLRLGLVTYRDFSVDGTGHLETILPLTTDYVSVEDAIQGIAVSGGGDEPEDVLDGLKAALDMDWRSGVVKLITLLGDAPAKDPDHAGNTTASICKYAEELDPVHVYALTCGGAPEGSPTWESFAAIANGTGAAIHRVDDVAELADALMQTVSAAVEKHKSEAGGSWGGGGGGGSDDLLTALLFVGSVVVVLLLAVVVQRRRAVPVAQGPLPHEATQCVIQATGPFGRRVWSYPDADPITIGRAPGNTVVLDDPQVSSSHAILRPLRNGWLLVDVGSRNGTFVAGRRVGRLELRGNESIRVGDSHLTVRRVPRTDR